MHRAESDSLALHENGQLPGYPVGSLGSHVPVRLGVLARLYLARRRAAAAFLGATVSVLAIGGAGFAAWKVHEAMEARAPSLHARQSPGTAEMTAEAADPDPGLAAAAERALERVRALAGQGGGETRLAEKRRDAALELARSGDLREARNVVRSIEGIATEMEARLSNASPLEAPEAPEPPLEQAATAPETAPDTAKLEAAFAGVEEKVSALESFLLSDAGNPAADDMSVALEIRIAGGEGQPSAFWRRSLDGEQQYFAIVEAVAQDGTPYAWKVEDMDTGEASRLQRWAQQVTEGEYARIAAEKAMGHSLPDPLAGTKAAGGTAISWRIDAAGGALADWKEGSE